MAVEGEFMKNYCPVCGYNLRKPVEDDLICPSCGTQFGYTDAIRSHAMLRQVWASNPHWFSRSFPQPAYWDPYAQLEQAGFVGFDRKSDTVTTTSQYDGNLVPLNENWNISTSVQYYVFGRYAEGLGLA